jgi:hypothetical protein
MDESGEGKGLRRQQRIEAIRKEFEKSEENPFNKAHVEFDASKEDIERSKKEEMKKVEERLGKESGSQVRVGEDVFVRLANGVVVRDPYPVCKGG